MKKVKLPPISSITSYESFFRYITKGIPKQRGMNINVMAVYLNKSNEKALSDHIKSIMRKKHKDFSDNWFNNSWGYYWLQYSPSQKKSVPNGYALIDASKIYVLPDRR